MGEQIKFIMKELIRPHCYVSNVFGDSTVSQTIQPFAQILYYLGEY